jgi:nucleoside-diphosphate-sugar epimerase
LKVLVTGAAGFVATHVVREMAAAGHHVVAVDLHDPPAGVLLYVTPVRDRVRFVRADLAVAGILDRAVPESVDGIVHAAVVTSTPDMEVAQPARVVDANVVGTAEVLRYARAAGVRRLLYVSSSGVYGNTGSSDPVAETHRLDLTTLYTVTKFASERLVGAEVAKGGLSGASVRIAAPYGPMERPTGTRTVMSPMYTLTHAAAARRAVTIARPTAVRDWTHADDIAYGLRVLLESPALRYDCYNLASGESASLAKVATTLADLAPGFTWEEVADAPDVDGRRVPSRGPLDTGRIRGAGFAPRRPLVDGLRDTLQWIHALESLAQERKQETSRIT